MPLEFHNPHNVTSLFMPTDLDIVLEGIQPDILRIEQVRLAEPYCHNLQMQKAESALAVLDGKTHAIVCVKNPDYPERDFLLVSYAVDGEGIYSITQEHFLTPEQVVYLKQKRILPHSAEH